MEANIPYAYCQGGFTKGKRGNEHIDMDFSTSIKLPHGKAWSNNMPLVFFFLYKKESPYESLKCGKNTMRFKVTFHIALSCIRT